jgi:hypothetical protein
MPVKAHFPANCETNNMPQKGWRVEFNEKNLQKSMPCPLITRISEPQIRATLKDKSFK